jgi:hypothetical protein
MQQLAERLAQDNEASNSGLRVSKDFRWEEHDDGFEHERKRDT